ncbi:hypothetical protein [Streptomyces zagrosensis]|uniref:Restriction endonuclease type IV Mrr domain-containing protein n=1 Tax=Streptomyces zagrosensis TaxID=1042984 RepID=A0A7W9Q9N7_9ACTN|nr:hypothetical protein [Streptomyces zagrosensis]MBB5936190.1 hypothetical protein [Streptomyces zagrosensis]
MAKSVPVRCPACSREHSFTPPTFPCACGAPLTLPVLPGPVARLQHRTWEDSWVAVRCHSCGRRDHWPHPELGCPCGTVIWLPVAEAPEETGPILPPSGGAGTASAITAHAAPSSAVLRPAFQPVTIRTGRDVVTAAGQYLKWLGFTSLRQVEDRAPSGVDLRGPGIVAQVDPTTRPTGVRDIECLWLHGLSEAAVSVFFSLAGYARHARSRADELYLPLFVMDLTGTPQPVNDPADDLIRMGPPEE